MSAVRTGLRKVMENRHLSCRGRAEASLRLQNSGPPLETRRAVWDSDPSSRSSRGEADSGPKSRSFPWSRTLSHRGVSHGRPHVYGRETNARNASCLRATERANRRQIAERVKVAKCRLLPLLLEEASFGELPTPSADATSVKLYLKPGATISYSQEAPTS